jgi:hypothetical protein
MAATQRKYSAQFTAVFTSVSHRGGRGALRGGSPPHPLSHPSGNRCKTKVVLEVIRGEKSPADACRTYKIHNSVLTRWQRNVLE